MHKEFVYIDSSQEQQEHLNKFQTQKHKQQYDLSLQQQGIPHFKSRYCLVHNPQSNLLKQTQYDQLVKKLLNNKIDKQVIKQLITNIQDKEVVYNINKRNANYRYFLQRIETDQKYRALQQEKADKLKQQNQRKKKVLYKYQNQTQMKSQQNQLKKYIITKKQKQERVVKHVKKEVKKLGFQRIYNAHRKMKQEIRANKIIQQHQLASRLNKQRNQLLQLQQQFQAIKQAKRINKLEQRKNITDLAEKIREQKQILSNKLPKKKNFQI